MDEKELADILTQEGVPAEQLQGCMSEMLREVPAQQGGFEYGCGGDAERPHVQCGSNVS